jgi:hypothetical protein
VFGSLPAENAPAAFLESSEVGSRAKFSTSNIVPPHFLIGVQNVDPIFVQAAQHAIAQTMKLAKRCLLRG